MASNSSSVPINKPVYGDNIEPIADDDQEIPEMEITERDYPEEPEIPEMKLSDRSEDLEPLDSIPTVQDCPCEPVYDAIPTENRITQPEPESFVTRFKPKSKSIRAATNNYGMPNPEGSVKYSNDGFPVMLIEDECVDWLIDNLHLVTISETKEILYYEDGVYKKDGGELARQILHHFFYKLKTKKDYPLLDRKKTEEIISKIIHLTSKPISEFGVDKVPFGLISNIPNLEPMFYNVGIPILNTQQGYISLDGYELYPHRTDILSLTQIPTAFDPDAECIGIQEKLDYHVDRKYHDCIYEMTGYTLENNSDMQKAFMLFGEKRTFKSTLLKLIGNMIGESNCSHVPLYKLVTDKFSVSQLYGKMLNYSGDLSPKPLPDLEIFKNLVGQDMVWAQHKFGHPFSFKYNGKLIFATNEIPRIKTYDEAYCVRWITIPFGNSVIGREDPKLFEKLSTPSEMSGLLNMSLEGLRRLHANKKFTYDLDYGLNLFKRQTNPVSAFLEDRCCASDNGIPKGGLIKEYNDWAKANNLPPASSMQAFGGMMKDQTVIPVSTYFPMIGNKQIESWSGISLKDKK